MFIINIIMPMLKDTVNTKKCTEVKVGFTRGRLDKINKPTKREETNSKRFGPEGGHLTAAYLETRQEAIFGKCRRKDPEVILPQRPLISLKTLHLCYGFLLLLWRILDQIVTR